MNAEAQDYAVMSAEAQDDATIPQQPPAKRRKIHVCFKLDKTPAEKNRVLELSHILWTVVLPHITPLYSHRILRSYFVSRDSKLEYDDTLYDDPIEGMLMCVGEAFFPLVALVSKRFASVWGSTLDAFCFAAAWNALNVAKWMLSNVDFNDGFYTKTVLLRPKKLSQGPVWSRVSAFTLCCSHNHLNFALWLVKELELDTVPAELCLDPLPIEPTIIEALELSFKCCCTHDSIDPLEWLCTRFSSMLDSDKLNMTRLQIGRSALLVACKAGNINSAKWISKRFRIPDDVPKFYPNEWVNNSDVFESACESGNITLITWVLAYFAISTRSVSITGCLQKACINGHLDAAIWICNTWHPNCYFEILFPMVCEAGHLDILKWIDAQYNITKLDITQEALPQALRNIENNSRAKEKYCEIIKWLISNFELTPVDLVEVFTEICCTGFNTVAEWFDSIAHITTHCPCELTSILNKCIQYHEYATVPWLLSKLAINPVAQLSPIPSSGLPSLYLSDRSSFDYIVETLDVLPTNIQFVKEACKCCCSLEDLQYLLQKFSVRTDDVRNADPLLYVESLDIFQWLSDTYQLSHDHACKNENTVLSRLCDIGDLKLVEWFVVHFNLTKQDAIYGFENSLCSKLEILKFLAKKFAFRKRDLNPKLFSRLCLTTDVEFLAWYVEHFGIDLEYLEQTGVAQNAFSNICCTSSPCAAKWFSETFRLPRVCNFVLPAFRLACIKRRYYVAHWIADSFVISQTEAKKAYSRVFDKQRFLMADWLLHTFFDFYELKVKPEQTC